MTLKKYYENKNKIILNHPAFRIAISKENFKKNLIATLIKILKRNETSKVICNKCNKKGLGEKKPKTQIVNDTRNNRNVKSKKKNE